MSHPQIWAPLHARIYSGGRLIAIFRFLKEGSRPLAIRDCFRRLAYGAVSSLTFDPFRWWFESTYTNTIQFANRTSQIADEHHAALLLALGCEAAPRIAQKDSVLDPVVVITFYGINTFNALKRHLLVDIIINKLF